MHISTVTLATSCFLVPFVTTAQTANQRATAPQASLSRDDRVPDDEGYGYLTVPTRIGFRGTLLAAARGEATVQVKRGSTIIDARFSRVTSPTRFGPQYLTYVAWAISSDGRAQNLGEISLSGSDKGKLSASTSLQAFAIIVTAEPYYTVNQPSDVAVIENEVRPDTVGKVEEMNATYELLPRKEFTYDMSRPDAPVGKPVSRHEYEFNARDLLGAERYPDRRLAERGHVCAGGLAKARQLLERAKAFPKDQSSELIATAKEAVQVAEDSRVIAQKRAEEERLAEEQSWMSEERSQAEMKRTAIEAGREQEERARTELATVKARQTERQAQVQTAAPPSVASERPIDVDGRQFSSANPQASENRRRLLSSLYGPFKVSEIQLAGSLLRSRTRGFRARH